MATEEPQTGRQQVQGDDARERTGKCNETTVRLSIFHKERQYSQWCSAMKQLSVYLSSTKKDSTASGVVQWNNCPSIYLPQRKTDS